MRGATSGFAKYDFRAISCADLARCFDITPRTVANWVDDGMPVANVSGVKWYDPAVVLKWKTDVLKKELKKKAPIRPQEIDPDMHESEGFDDNLDKYRHYKAEQAKLALEKEQGKLIELEAHEEFVRDAGDFVRNSMQGLPKELAIKLAKSKDSNEIEDMLNDKIVAILKEMSCATLN